MDEPYIIKNNFFADKRGYFRELYNIKYTNSLKKFSFVQDNISFSKKGTIRGLHYQFKVPQAKLLSVLIGDILDVVVDLRKKSKSFKKKYYFKLNDKKNSQLFVPRGFAHGFQCVSKFSIVHYKCDNYYAANDQSGIIYNDKELNIKWPIKKIIISNKDKKLPRLQNIKNFF